MTDAQPGAVATASPAAADGSERRAGDQARFECGVCWHVYDPAVGDAVWQVPPGTPFGALPTHWSCPNCGTEATRFMVVGDE